MAERNDAGPRGAGGGEDQPRYGMRLPEGARIEDYIVPRAPRGSRGAAAVAGSTAASADPSGRRAETEEPRPDAAGPARDDRRPAAHDPAASGPEAGPGPFAGLPPGSAPGRPPGHPRPAGAGYPPGPVHPPAPAPREERLRRARRRRATTVAIVAGIVMVLGPLIGLVVSAYSGISGNLDAITSSLPVRNGAAVKLPADATRSVTGTGSTPLEQCTVLDPAGSQVPVETVVATPTREDTMALPGARFRTGEAGEYTITCADLDEGERLMVGPPLVLRDVTSAALWANGGLLLGALGLGTLIWAILTLVRTRRR